MFRVNRTLSITVISTLLFLRIFTPGLRATSSPFGEKEFLDKVQCAMLKVSNSPGIASLLRSANILVAPEKGNTVALYISGRSPILSSENGKNIAKLLQSAIYDIFDIVSPPEKTSIQRDSLLAYSKVTCLIAEFNKLKTPKPLKKGAIMAIEDDLEQIARIYASSSFLNKYRQSIETIKNQVSQKRNEFENLIQQKEEARQKLKQTKKSDPNYDKCLQKYESALTELSTNVESFQKSIAEQVDISLKDIKLTATTAVRSYLDNLKLYYKSISQIEPGTANAALFGLEILSKVPVDTQIAYTIAPCKITECALRELAESQTTQLCIPDGFFKQQWEIATNSKDKFWKIQPMYGVVKLFHSEPMYIYKNINQIPMAMPLFFTQRDMCETCAPLVSKFAETKKSHIDVISMKACFGQTRQESIVDFVYENAKITETKPNQQKLSSVRRIRIPKFLTIKLSSDLLKNIPET